MTERARIHWTPRPIVGEPLLSMVVAAYESPDSLLCLLYSFRSQSYDNWEAIVVHDGPGATTREAILRLNDSRVRLIETEERKGGWGHPWRDLGLKASTGDYVGMSNDDNWYAPVYFETMLHEATTKNADFVYCNMIHSFMGWMPLATQPRKQWLDLGAWICKGETVRTTDWTDMAIDGDGTYIDALVAKSKTIAHVPNFMFVHN